MDMNGTSTVERSTLIPVDDALAIGNADELAVRVRRLAEHALRPNLDTRGLIRESNEVRELLGLLNSWVDEVLS